MDKFCAFNLVLWSRVFAFLVRLNGRVCSGNGNSLRYSGDVIGPRMHRGRGDPGSWLVSFDIFGGDDSDVLNELF